MGLISTGVLEMGSTAAVGRLTGVKMRAFDTLGLTVATFFGRDALGRALALGSRRPGGRLGDALFGLDSSSDPAASSVADF